MKSKWPFDNQVVNKASISGGIVKSRVHPELGYNTDIDFSATDFRYHMQIDAIMSC